MGRSRGENLDGGENVQEGRSDPLYPQHPPPCERRETKRAHCGRRKGGGREATSGDGDVRPGVRCVADVGVRLALREPFGEEVGRHVFGSDVAELYFTGGDALKERVVSTHEVTGSGGGGAQGSHAHVGQVVGADEGRIVERDVEGAKSRA